MPTRRQNAAAVLALLTTVTLAGCTDAAAEPPPTAPATSASPTPEPTPTITPTPTASPTPTATVVAKPEPPTALDGPANEENAAAVASYFLQLYPYLHATGDSAAWDDLSAPDCEFCTYEQQRADADVAAGRYGTGGQVEAEVVSTWPVSEAEWTVAIDAHQAPSATVNAVGEVLEEYPSALSRLAVVVRWEAGTWVVRSVGDR